MMNTHTRRHVFSDKIVNLHLARMALHADKISGKFRVIVRFKRPGHPPACMKVTGQHSPGHFNACIPCGEIENAARDHNVVSLEVCEHVMQ